MANKTIEKVTLEERVERLKSNLGEFHQEALETTDKMVDISLDATAKWQKLFSKVLRTGTDLIGKQQDFTLNVLEEVKGQVQSGNKQFMELVGLDLTKARKAAKLRMESLTANLSATKTSDDLKEINGIGPKVEQLLNAAGINSFEELANAPVESLRAVLESAGKRYASMDPTSWKELAQEAMINSNNQ